MRCFVRITVVAVALILMCAWARGDDPLVVDNPADASGFVTVKFKLSKGDDVQWDVSPKPTKRLTFVDGDYSVLVLNGPSGVTYTATADWINWDAKKRGRPSVDVVIGKAPQPPPGPGPGPTPTPTPPDPSGPLRVIFVYETSQALTPQQQWVVFGEKTRNYLTTNSAGWRRYDKDADPVNEKDAELKSLWTDSKPKITAVPCVVVASGKTADILPLPATEDEAIELFKKYGGK